jgi:hypothetical protein
LIQINKRAILAIEPPTESGKFGQSKMAIPHWLIALVIFALLGALSLSRSAKGKK